MVKHEPDCTTRGALSNVSRMCHEALVVELPQSRIGR
jgi:hypothetical protein